VSLLEDKAVVSEILLYFARTKRIELFEEARIFDLSEGYVK
jgi:hypothetical protein